MNRLPKKVANVSSAVVIIGFIVLCIEKFT